MRSLALLLILINSVLFAWQNSLLPWIPWQPSFFRDSEQQDSPTSSGLTQLVLLSEQNQDESGTNVHPVKNTDTLVVADAHTTQVLNTPNQNTSTTKTENSSTDSANSVENQGNNIEVPINQASVDDKNKNLKTVTPVSKNPESVQNTTNESSDPQIIDNPKENGTPVQPKKQPVFLSSFANLNAHFMSTTLSLLNAPINESTTVEIGKGKYVAATDSTDRVGNPAQNAEMTADNQQESTNSEKSHISYSADSKGENAQSIDSLSDSSNSMSTFTKTAPIPIKTSEKFQNTEKTSKIEESGVEKNTSTEAAINQSKNAELGTKTHIQFLCFEAGPYVHSDTAKNVMDWFTKQKVNAKIQQRKTSVLESIWVYLPPFRSNATALQMQQQLTKSGIQDHSLATWKKNSNIVSLGLYRDPVNAELRIKELKDKGYFDVRSEKVYKNDAKRYWLNVKISLEQSPLIDSFRKNFDAYTSLQAITCD